MVGCAMIGAIFVS